MDGQDIRSVTRDSLRKSYSMVLQDTWLFHGTIFENIAYAKPGATREEVVAVAKAAHIHRFIMSLPQGYDTVLTDEGANVSKGQKQLLTIARAMLVDARMLILDEATSNVDTHTEAQIQQAMRAFDEGQDLLHRRAPAVHDQECRPHPRGEGRQRGGKRYPQ